MRDETDGTRERVYRFVREQLAAGRPPTIREVQAAVGLKAVESARAHLEGLVSEGRLLKEQGRSRGYRLPGASRPRPPVQVPLLGRVQAGALTTAVEDPEGYVPVVGRDGELFALRVRGESMSGAGILPGDLVIVRRQSTAEPGDVVVALVGDEATVKRLRFRQGRPELHAENPAFPTLVPEPEALTLLGKVVEVRRYFEAPSGGP